MSAIGEIATVLLAPGLTGFASYLILDSLGADKHKATGAAYIIGYAAFWWIMAARIHLKSVLENLPT